MENNYKELIRKYVELIKAYEIDREDLSYFMEKFPNVDVYDSQTYDEWVAKRESVEDSKKAIEKFYEENPEIL